MPEILESVFAFPTLLFTFPLGIALVYWVFVIIGAVDLDLFDGAIDGVAEGAADGIAEGAAEGLAEGAAEGLAEGAAEGLAEGAAEGLAEGAAEGLAEGAAEGLAEGAAEGLTEGAAEGAADGMEGALEASTMYDGPLAIVASVLHLGKIPITVTLSLILLFGWFLSGVGTTSVEAVLPSGILGWIARAGIGIAALFAGTTVTSFILRPFENAFQGEESMKSAELVGRTCKLTTNRVEDGFGQGSLFANEAELAIQIRCRHDNALTTGDEALIIDYNAKTQTYDVEPYRELLDELSESQKNTENRSARRQPAAVATKEGNSQ